MIINNQIKNADNEDTLSRLMTFIRSVLGPDKERCQDYTYEAWQRRLREEPALLLYAEAGNEIIGVVFGRVDNESITLGPVATRADCRRCGIGKALMMEMENRVKQKGFHQIGLGAREEAENFYLSLGYQPFLFIQDKKPRTLDNLRRLNSAYKETGAYDSDSDIRLMLETPQIDKQLQHLYDSTFPGCSTQTVFIKHI